MNKLSVIVLGKQYDVDVPNGVEIIYSDGTDLLNDVKKAKTKYVSFINCNDYISSNYFDRIKDIIDEDFDTCYIKVR